MTDTPRMPKIGDYIRLRGELVEIQDVTPPPPPVPLLDYIFEDTSATVRAMANGMIVAQHSTFNNWSGRDTCVEAATQYARSLRRRTYKGTNIEVVVVKITTRYRLRPQRGDYLYDKEFVRFEYLDSGSSWGMPEDVEEVVWSSKRRIKKCS